MGRQFRCGRTAGGIRARDDDRVLHLRELQAGLGDRCAVPVRRTDGVRATLPELRGVRSLCHECTGRTFHFIQLRGVVRVFAG
jgi:hypothetical protein